VSLLKRSTLCAVAVSACFTFGCGGSPDSGQKPVGRANPASLHCIEKGGELRIEVAADGGQVGICVLEDGVECDEWALYRGECP